MESTNLTDGSSVDAHQEIEMLIHDAYTNCIRSFSSCKVCPHLAADSLELVHDEANRFEIWGTNTGSCLHPSLSSSLDHRLRNSPGTREMVVLLLRAIRVNLDYASRIFDQEPEALDSLRDQNSNGAVLEAQQRPASEKIVNSLSSEALLAVHGLISQLKKLSATIRRATANEDNVQAAKRRDVDKDRNDMGKEDEIWAQQIVNYHFRNKKDGVPGSTDEMRDIISTGISFRMRRFRDWKRHFEKQQKRQEAIAQAELARESERLGGQEDDDAKDNNQEEDGGDTGARESVGPGGSAPSKMQGGVRQPSSALSKQSFQSSRFEAPKSISKSTASSPSTRSVIDDVYMDWPRPPQDATGTGQVRCPYCFELLDKQEVSSKPKWRGHVKKDLEPYGCFYPECNKALLKMFASEARWIGHIRAAHTPGGTWVCRMMPHNSSPGAVVVLSTEEEFKGHLESEHAGMYPKSRIDTMAKGAYRPHQTKVEDIFRDECPMRCPASLDESPKTAIVLGVPHVANHLLSLALQALPERSVRSSQSEFNSHDDDDGGNEDAGARKRAVRGTIRDGLETLPDPSFKDPPERPTTGAERDTELQLSGDRLNFYGYLPSVQRQHRELDEISQVQDPTMEPFIEQQMGINDVSALGRELIQRDERRRLAARRWTNVSISFKFLYLLGAFSAKGNHSLADSEEEQDVKKTTVNHGLSDFRKAVELTERRERLARLQEDLEWTLKVRSELINGLDNQGHSQPMETYLNQANEEISCLRSEILEVESEILKAKRAARVLDEDGISSTTGKGKLKESGGATSDWGSQPIMCFRRASRDGGVDFVRFDDLTNSHVCVGKGKIGRVDVEINLSVSETIWGVMGGPDNPAAIIYMDFVVRTPKNFALRSWRIEISLHKEISDGSKPKGDEHHVLWFTDSYGPKHMRGPKYTVSRVENSAATVGALGSAVGALGVEKEHHTVTKLPRWQFEGRRLQSNPNDPRYDTLAWEMENSKAAPPLDWNDRSIFHVAFAIQHDAQEFYLRTRVTGKLTSSPQERGIAMDSDNGTVIRVQFPSRESYLSSNNMPLDMLVRTIHKAMPYETMNEVPPELDPE